MAHVNTPEMERGIAPERVVEVSLVLDHLLTAQTVSLDSASLK
jgi:hypothetical protein